MNRTLVTYEIPGRNSYSERITGVTWSGSHLWYARGAIGRIGRLSPGNGSYREYQIDFPAPQTVELDGVAAMRRAGPQRSARLAVAARQTNGMVVFDESPLAARQYELGGYKRRPDHDLVIHPNLVAVARDNSPWISALVREASANPSLGNDWALIQFSLGPQSRARAKVLRLSPTCGSVGSIWFDQTNRAWLAFGLGNFNITLPYIFGVLLGTGEVACYEIPNPVPNYLSVTGQDAADTVVGIHPGRQQIVKAPDIGIPFVGPSSFRTIGFHDMPGLTIHQLASDSAGHVWFSALRGTAGHGVGFLDHAAPPQDEIQVSALHEPVSALPNEVKVTELKVAEVASGRATIARTVVAASTPAPAAVEIWPTPHRAAFLTTGATRPWFAFPELRIIATLTA